MTGVIAKDTIQGTDYEYRVATIEREGFNHQIQVRFAKRDGSKSAWEGATMGHYPSDKDALEAFLVRYRRGDFEAIHPIIIKAVEKKERENKQIEASRSKQAAEDVIKRGLDDMRRQLVEADFKKAKFVTGTAPITGGEGNKIGEVTGPSIGGLVISKTDGIRRIKDTAYQITHIKSGFSVGPKYQTQRDAKIAAFRLSNLGDFTGGVEGLPKNIPFTTLANRMQTDPLADFRDKLPPAGESSLSTGAKSVIKEQIEDLKKTQQKRQNKILSRTPTAEELLAVAPDNVQGLFLFPTGKAIPRSDRQANRLLESALVVAEKIDKVAQTTNHPGFKTLDALTNLMTDEDRESFLGLLPEKTVPFYEKAKRQSLAKKSFEQRKTAMLQRIQKRTEAKLGPEILREFEVSFAGQGPKIVVAEFTSDAINKFAREQSVREVDKGQIEARFIKEVKKPEKALSTTQTFRQQEGGLSTRAAVARFNNPNAGVSKGNKRRNPKADALFTAQIVAPANAKTEADLKAQKRWFKNPGRSDLEGIDTGPRRRTKALRTKKKAL